MRYFIKEILSLFTFEVLLARLTVGLQLAVAGYRGLDETTQIRCLTCVSRIWKGGGGRTIAVGVFIGGLGACPSCIESREFFFI